MENILEPLPVGRLLQQENDIPKYNFFIPAYQRGYRWDEEQVEDLLNDLLEFITTSKSREEKYCLQPIVVKKLEDGRYEVLDGQQRLTTIFILLSRLKKNNSEIDLFALTYETRPNSAAFLKNIDETINNENPDFYYISNAYVTINNWLKKTKNIKANIATSLFEAIVESIEFIWYEIKNDVDAIDVFTRINIGKIPLTNAELVKAVFLSKNNLSFGYASADNNDKEFNKILTMKHNDIALEWDSIEKLLQDPKVWGFIYSGSSVFETRIDYLLDLQSHKSPSDKNKYFAFKYFYDKVKNVRNDKTLLAEYAKNNSSFIEKEWSDLKGIFDILLEWYNDKTYNHLIGFLINQGESITDIIDDFGNNNRNTFLDIVKAKIKSLINCNDISLLRYNNGSDKQKLDKILLLHNVIGSLLIKDNNVYFPFDRMKGKAWTLEHIFAQNSDELREEDYFIWLDDHLRFFKSKSINEEVKEIITCIEELFTKNDKKIDKEDFQDCFNKVATYIQKKIEAIDETEQHDENTSDTNEDEYGWINEDHSIANLALLDGSINSAIKNSLFDIKRGLILNKDKEGLFVPYETKKVFLKYYTSNPNHLAYWTFDDRKAYIKNIKSTLKYLNKTA
jgi:uncharacterized protein with ParB-like and HNH nuclease domain